MNEKIITDDNIYIKARFIMSLLCKFNSLKNDFPTSALL